MIDFLGDGRTMIYLPEGALGALPMAVTRAAARHAIQRFEAERTSTHSRNCRVLWIILEYCEQMALNYRLEYYPGQGAIVSLIDPLA